MVTLCSYFNVAIFLLLLFNSCLPQQLRQTRKEGNAQRNRMERPRAPDGAQLQTVGKLKTNSRRTDARRKEEEGNVRSRPQSDRHHVAEAFQEERVLSQKGSDQNTNGRTVHRQPVKSVKSAAEMAKDYIAYRLPCSTDVDSLCSNVQRENNFQVLFCLQRQPEAVSRECHQVLWQFKLGLTQDEGLDRTIAHWCSSEVSSNKCDTVKHGNGELLPCLLAIRRDMKSVNCQNILLRIQMIVFSDFRLIRGFVEDCRSDIEKFNCAKVEVLDRSLVEQIEVPQKSQGATIACLEMHIDDLSLACQKRLVQKEEQAASDINLDRALVQACQQELGTFCSHVPPKEPGGQYDCLFHHKFDRAVSKDCKKQIKRRQKIEGRDYKADYSFSKACKDDIELHHCAESNINYGFGRMAKIILCLDEASMDKSSQLSKDCQSQMLDAKERMMGDYELSHGLVDACHEDVNDYCKHEADSNEEGAVIECLMGKVTDDGNEDDESQPRMGAGKLKTGCAEELQKLIQRADPGSDYHIDHVLERACKPFINSDCPPDTGEGDAAVLSCLMEKADSDKMPSDCRKHLLHLQYFIARDFKLDHQLYSKCKDDAARVCKSAIMNPNGMTEMEGNAENIPPQMILACLYRADIEYEDNIDDNSHQVSRKCHTDILRVLRERALSIQLNPAIHEACLQDLGSFCPPSSDDSSEEFKCLQQNIDKVSLQCQQSLKEWTAAEAEDIRINKPLMRECKHPILKFCKEVVSEGAGKLVQCLVAHKNDKDVSQNCRQQIQSFQEISMKDKSFDFNLRKFCRNDGKRLCPNVKTRVQVLDCFKGVLMDGQKRTSISGDCLAQLKLALKEVVCMLQL
ncbi:Golgi apparatus protein 1-like isoform X2 [Corticium candelabrum]|uniref:Golgi apparatus protein 1-like isoform X2 n=1 Tax=Corticium candelabrum TaxID=121492 RepID=UPI002E272A3F|nr:Golgi apparatus protein 1-like isoform X2 [Corticium candelabrum]